VVEIIIAFLAGLLIGSFLNVCVYRLPLEISVAQPARSFCPGCEKTIAWYDNVPVLSFLLLRGRCRNCKARIPLRYPVVELATGLAFALCVAAFGVTLLTVKYAILSAILITLIATDFEEHFLPDEFTLGGTLIGLVLAVFIRMDPGIVNLLMPYSLSWRWVSLAESAFSAAFFSGIVWFAGWLYEKVRHREGMGLGDVKMLAMVGAFLGTTGSQLTLIIGGVFGVILGGGYILIAREKASEYELPYGSFLGFGAFVAVGMWYFQQYRH